MNQEIGERWDCNLELYSKICSNCSADTIPKKAKAVGRILINILGTKKVLARARVLALKYSRAIVQMYRVVAVPRTIRIAPMCMRKSYLIIL